MLANPLSRQKLVELRSRLTTTMRRSTIVLKPDVPKVRKWYVATDVVHGALEDVVDAALCR